MFWLPAASLNLSLSTPICAVPVLAGVGTKVATYWVKPPAGVPLLETGVRPDKVPPLTVMSASSKSLLASLKVK